MMNLEQACVNYYHKGFLSYEHTSPVSGIVTINTQEGKYKQIVYIKDNRLTFGDVEKVNPVGRPKTYRPEIAVYKKEGKTQEWIARQMDISLSTVKRYWSEKRD